MFKRILFIAGSILVSATVLASDAGHAEAPSLLSLEMLFKTINFIILLALLWKFARKPIAKMLSTSATNAKNTVDAAKSELAEAQQKIAEYESKIADLESELAKRQETSLAAIEAEKDQMIADAKAQAQKLEEQAQNIIDQNIIRAKAEIKEYLVKESVSLAEQIITEQISPKDHKALIDNYANYLKNSA